MVSEFDVAIHISHYYWLIAAMIASALYSISDLLCDVCIGELNEQESISSKSKVDSQHNATQYFSPTNVTKSDSEQNAPLLPSSIHSMKHKNKKSKSMCSLINMNSQYSDEEENKGQSVKSTSRQMTGEQDCAVATAAIVFVMVLREITRLFINLFSANDNSTMENQNFHNNASNLTLDSVFVFASFGGVLTFAGYFSILKSYETSNSTVILPLRQVVSFWLFFGSSVTALLLHQTWFKFRDLVPYFGLLIGGILPASRGRLKTMANTDFWSQSFVLLVILSELSFGTYDLMLSYTTQANGRFISDSTLEAASMASVFDLPFISSDDDDSTNGRNLLEWNATNPISLADRSSSSSYIELNTTNGYRVDDSHLNLNRLKTFRSLLTVTGTEKQVPLFPPVETSNGHTMTVEESGIDVAQRFFFISRISFVVTFFMLYFCFHRLRQEVSNLQYVKGTYLFLSFTGELLCLAGDYVCAYAYSWYYQPSVVYIAEASANQLFTLALAYVLRKWFKVGRRSATKDLKTKGISFVIVFLSLLCLVRNETIDEE
eukprot:g5287.t1